MTLFVLRPENEAMEWGSVNSGICSIGWDHLPDLSEIRSIDEMRTALEGEGNELAGQAWTFSHVIRKGDHVVMPMRGEPTMYVGKVTGDYEYRPDTASIHRIPVRWMRRMPDAWFDKDVRRCLRLGRSVNEVRSTAAIGRLASLMARRTPSIDRDCLSVVPTELRDKVKDAKPPTSSYRYEDRRDDAVLSAIVSSRFRTIGFRDEEVTEGAPSVIPPILHREEGAMTAMDYLIYVDRHRPLGDGRLVIFSRGGLRPRGHEQVDGGCP